MEISDFIAETLKQITEAAKVASDKEQKFYLDTTTSKGVHFNLAVVNTETNSKTGGGKAKAKIFKIAIAEIGKSNNSTTISESISRVEFNIKYDTPGSAAGGVMPKAPHKRVE